MVSEKLVKDFFAKAGIEINGPNPWDPQVDSRRDLQRMCRAMVWKGSIGMGESYMEGLWSCKRLDMFFDRLMRSGATNTGTLRLDVLWHTIKSFFVDLQSLKRAQAVAEHYNLDSSFYQLWLDERMAYTSALWEKPCDSLERAQTRKMKRMCELVELREGESVYDIGCGWASWMGYAANYYGALPHGITIAQNQIDYARKRYHNLPLTFSLMDWRHMREPVQKIVSIEMFEQVGKRHEREFFEKVRACIPEDGIFGFQGIFAKSYEFATDPWTNKYIFPGGALPTLEGVQCSSSGIFRIADVLRMGDSYDKTLMAWNERFQLNRSSIVKSTGEKFCRMWEYYLQCFAGSFRSGHIDVAQIKFVPART